MPDYKTQVYRCSDSECLEHWEELVERDIIDQYAPQCPLCGASSVKCISAPMVLKASYPDGMRAKTAGWKDLKEAAALKAEADNMSQNRPIGDRKSILEERTVRQEAERIAKQAKSIKLHE